MKSLKNRIAAVSVAVLSLLIAGPVAVANAAVAVAPPATVTVSSSLNGTYYTGTLLVLWSPAVAPAGSSVVSYTVDGAGQEWTGITNQWLVVPNLHPGQDYNFCVSAVTTAGTSPCSTTVTATAVGIPGSPYNVLARPGNGQSVVSWTPSPYYSGLPVTGYLVTDNAGDSCQTTSTTCTLTGLINNTTYTVTVVALNALGKSWASYPTTVVVSTVTVPGIPTFVSWSTANGNLTVNWALPADNGGWPVTNTVVALNGKPACDSPGLSCTVWMLPVGSIQQIQIYSQNAVGSGAWSAPVWSQVGSAPSAPTFGYSAAGVGAVVLTWTNPYANVGLAISSYSVSNGQGQGCTVPGSQTWCVINSLRPGLAQTFTVTATNVMGTSVPSAALTITPIGPAGAPTNVMATSSSPGTVTVNWVAPSWVGGSPITNYIVAASTGTQCQSASTSCTVTGLTSGTSVTFVVVAQNAAGNSPASVPVTLTVA